MCDLNTLFEISIMLRDMCGYHLHVPKHLGSYPLALLNHTQRNRSVCAISVPLKTGVTTYVTQCSGS